MEWSIASRNEAGATCTCPRLAFSPSPSPATAYFLPLPFAWERSLAATLLAADEDFGLERILDVLLASPLLVVMAATSPLPTENALGPRRGREARLTKCRGGCDESAETRRRDATWHG